MREASIILPLNDNDGNGLLEVHNSLARALSEAFGGCTAVASSGYWYHEGRLYDEPGRVFTTAAEPTAVNNKMIAFLAKYYGEMAKQIAVYYRDFDGNVHIDDIVKAEAA